MLGPGTVSRFAWHVVETEDDLDAHEFLYYVPKVLITPRLVSYEPLCQTRQCVGRDNETGEELIEGRSFLPTFCVIPTPKSRKHFTQITTDVAGDGASRRAGSRLWAV